MSDNWVVQNLQNALDTWNEKLAEIWQLITTTPQDFKGGGIWSVIVNINGAVQAIALALLVLFFVVGMVKTCGSFTEVKKAGARSQAVCQICACKRCNHLRNGANARFVQYHSGCYYHHYEHIRHFRNNGNGIAAGNDNHH